jgi:hypothetical protein
MNPMMFFQQQPQQPPIKHLMPQAMFNDNSGYNTFIKTIALVAAGCGTILAIDAFARKVDGYYITR